MTMGTITVLAAPCLRARLYDEGAALPYRGMSVLDDKPWNHTGKHILWIVTDQTPAGNMGRGHFNAFIEGDRIKFSKDLDV